MFLHAPCPQRLENLSQGHPLYGLDLRTLSDERLADAGARAIIPDWASVWHHLDHQNTAHSEIANLASSILRRVTRVIVWSTRLARLTEDSDFSLDRLDELLEATTLTYIQMVGAFDAIAIINGLLSGQTNYPAMAWQRRRFRDSVRLVAPRAAELMDDGTPGDLYFQAIRAFRNTIHKRMPDVGTSAPHQGDPAHTKAILTLESNGHREIIDTFTAVGWTKFVGIDLAGPDWLFLRPETAVNLLKAEGIPLLNELLAATPADRLGPARFALDDDATLYPRQMQDYALEYLHLGHLVPKPR
ncbi:hypothetical protein M3B48_008655 [Micrococcus luteus]|uniref:hypothetical protein n=1 Tax=Micrococcus luteus TaxID=1270 RepID=UPI0029D86FE2|nr:hypothetical protein [Micrococcus luteus]MCV7632877.1 hypothetical protein [Micrococcus luteus]